MGPRSILTNLQKCRPNPALKIDFEAYNLPYRLLHTRSKNTEKVVKTRNSAEIAVFPSKVRKWRQIWENAHKSAFLGLRTPQKPVLTEKRTFSRNGVSVTLKDFRGSQKVEKKTNTGDYRLRNFTFRK